MHFPSSYPIDTFHLEYEGPAVAVGKLADENSGNVIREEHPADEGICVI